MKKVFYLLSLLASFSLNAQQLFTENFNYPIGSSLVANGWLQIGNTSTNPVLVDSNALQYSGYFASGLGKAAVIGNTGQDVYVETSSSVSSASVYCSFLIKPSFAQTAGDYFIAFLPSNSNTNYAARVYIKSASLGYYTIGFSKSNETAVYSQDSFQVNNTALVVIKYTFNLGANTNDTVSLYHFANGFPLAEPTPSLKLGATATDIVNVSRVALRQGNATNAPNVLVGGIRMSASWEDLNTATIIGQPKNLSGFRFNGRQANTSQIIWTKPTGYIDSLQNILVFLRKDTLSTFFPTPSAPASSYTASANFANPLSIFEFDSLAKCVYQGDGNSVTISNLETNTTYYAVAYVVRTDTAWYGNASFSNGRTVINPAGSLTVNPVTSISVNSSWVNSQNYQNGIYTTLVFMKEGSPINYVNPTRFPNSYTASNTFGSGTKFQEDSLAFCVYRGNQTNVTTTGLKSGVDYHVAVFFVRTADSLYSLPATAVGTVAGPAPYREIGPLVRTNTTSGIIDSNAIRASIRGVVHGINLRATGLQFVLRDLTGGISIYSTNRNFGYAVAEGDSLEVSGTISQLNGLAIISTLDTVILLGKNAKVDGFNLVQTLNEQTENKPVAVAKLRLLSILTNWPTNGTVLAKNEESGDTIRVRIYTTAGFNQVPAPTGFFAVKGMGLQTSTSFQAPFAFNGYAVAPRNPNDITIINDSLSDFELLTPSQNAVITIDGDSSGSILFANTAAKILQGIGSVNYQLLIDEPNGDFQTPLIKLASGNGGLDTNFMLTYLTLLQNLPGLANIGDTVKVRAAVKATLNTTEKMSSNAVNITFIRGNLVGISDLVQSETNIQVYPNPATEFVVVKSNQKFEVLTLYNLLGEKVRSIENAERIELSGISKGIYLLEVKGPKGLWVQKIMIE